MALIGELAVNVVARTDKFKRGMKKARKEVDHFAKATKKAQGVIVKSFAAMAAAVGIHKLQSAITDTIDSRRLVQTAC